MTQNNPLSQPFNTPYNSVPFNNIKPEHFEPAVKQCIDRSKKKIHKIVQNNQEPTFDNTLLPLEVITDEINRLATILFNLDAAETNKSIQAVTQKVSPLITGFTSKMLSDPKLFKRVKQLHNQKKALNLNNEQIHLIDETYRQMVRNGALLKGFKKFRLIQTKMKLSKLSLKFSDHVLAETNSFELHLTNKQDLAGLPAYVIDAAKLTAQNKKKEGWVFTLQFPSYGPFMKFSDRRDLRKKIFLAFASRGFNNNKNNNETIIQQIVSLRLRQAQLLGYPDYASYVLEEQMAEEPHKVNDFLLELHNASAPFAAKELDELQKFAEELGFDSKIEPWDFNYFSEKLKHKSYGFNEEKLKPYFKMENVVDGVFELATTLYGIGFKKVNHIPVYHNEVETYEVYDKDHSFLSLLYIDLFPRESKQGGAWMTDYQAQHKMNGENIRPHVSLCCNFTRPTTNQPSLLTFQEVTTLLHEFGHALHGIFANTQFPSLSGTNVYRDFVELPSQLLENWAYEKEWLDTFAVHYKTGKKMPEELIDQLIEARNFNAGYASERQLTFGMCDMAWHTINKEFKGNIKAFEKNATQATQLFAENHGTCISTAFSHIFAGGYAAGYYGYKWAEVLDADVFSVFKSQGIYNTDVAESFRKNILEKGGTSHPMKLYLNFRGQKPQIEALLKREGLINTLDQ